MNLRSLVACFFAAYGIYLMLTGVFGAFATVAQLFAPHRMSDLGGYGVLMQFVMVTPLVLGLLVLFTARRLAALTIQFAGADGETSLPWTIDSRGLLTVLLVTLGAYFVISNVAALARGAFVLFQQRAAEQVLGSGYRSDATQLLPPLIALAGGILLVRRHSWVVAFVFGRR